MNNHLIQSPHYPNSITIHDNSCHTMTFFPLVIECPPYIFTCSSLVAITITKKIKKINRNFFRFYHRIWNTIFYYSNHHISNGQKTEQIFYVRARAQKSRAREMENVRKKNSWNCDIDFEISFFVFLVFTLNSWYFWRALILAYFQLFLMIFHYF